MGVVESVEGLADSTVESVVVSVVDPNVVGRVGDVVDRAEDIVDPNDLRGVVAFVESSVGAFTVEPVTLLESSALHCMPCRRAPNTMSVHEIAIFSPSV